jgi:hypothetical protein
MLDLRERPRSAANTYHRIFFQHCQVVSRARRHRRSQPSSSLSTSSVGYTTGASLASRFLFGELTLEQRDAHCWTAAIHMINAAIKEPRYLAAATITLQTALRLSGMLAPDNR